MGWVSQENISLIVNLWKRFNFHWLYKNRRNYHAFGDTNMIGDYNENFDEERERKFVEEHGAIQEIYIKDGRYYLF